MKNNFTSSKKPKIGFVALLLFFCVLWGNDAMGQVVPGSSASNDILVWTGTVSSDWNNVDNWYVQSRAVAGIAGISEYPGQDQVDDWAIIPSNGANAPIIKTGEIIRVGRLYVTNQFNAAGGTLTIDSGGRLNVYNIATNQTNCVFLQGGSIVNNGQLFIDSVGIGFSGFPSYGIQCGTPNILPTVPTEWGYSGSGTLSINLTGANFAGAGAIVVTGINSTNATYRMVLNNPTITLNQVTNLGISAIRANGGVSANKLIIAGTGLTLGTVGSPVKAGLLNIGNQANVVVESGTTLTLNSAPANANVAITGGNSSNNITTEFVNKGTINVVGSSTRSGLQFSTFGGSQGPPNVQSPNASIVNFTNEGIINIDLDISALGQSAFNIGNGGGGSANAGSIGNLINASKGIITLKNRSTIVGTGFAITATADGQAPKGAFINAGTLNLESSVYHYGARMTITNTGVINSNNEFRSFSGINNNAGGSINFIRTAATAINKQVIFNGLPTGASASPGTIYTDGTNNYTVVIAKYSDTFLITNIISSASTASISPTSGSLTRVSAAGGDFTLTYTATAAVVGPPAIAAIPSFSESKVNGAISTGTSNSGTINTDTASNLNIISGVTTTSNSAIAPGGSAGKGIVEFTGAAKTILGKLIVQVAGNTTAGVDYDQIINQTVDGGFDVTGATLDVTGIYTPVVSPTTIPIILANGIGTITGPFATVTGLTAGWKVDYLSGTVNLVYDSAYVPPTPVDYVWNGSASSAWTTAANWTPPGLPDQNSDVTIAVGTNQPTISTDASIKSLIIDSGVTLTVTGPNLTVKEAITNNGTMTLASNSNLVQIDNVANTGNITVNRNSNALSRLDYTLWSSPVTNIVPQFLSAFSPATDVTRFYTYNEGTNLYNSVDPTATPFASATGYLIRMPNDAVTAPATQTFAGIFTGVPNNGDIPKPLLNAVSGYNAIGNPYPSTINAEAFITANTLQIESSLYFWRKINAASGTAYAVYNPLGSTRTASSALPNGTIQVGQGFFVKAKAGATSVSFTNALRLTNNQNQFFKTRATQKDRLWLNLTSNADVFSQALVGYTADATLAVDMYDAKFINDSPIALTSSINGEEFTIQGRPAFDASDVIALNFKTDAAGNYKIALDQFDGVFATGQDVYLVDSKTGAETDLKAGNYTFTADAGVDNARFSLKYQKTLKVDAPAFNDNSISVYADNGSLFVNSKSTAISNVTVYDVQGRIIAQKGNVKSTTAVINNLRANNQVLIVKIEGEDNSVVTKKLLN